MRVIAPGWCAALVFCIPFSASAAALQSSGVATQHFPAGAATPQSPPIAVNDHDGGFIPRPSIDRGFTINPDGPTSANYSGNSDQDEDGSDIAIYQGEDDQLPS
jgi:hypothetical protein